MSPTDTIARLREALDAYTAAEREEPFERLYLPDDPQSRLISLLCQHAPALLAVAEAARVVCERRETWSIDLDGLTRALASLTTETEEPTPPQGAGS